MRFLRGQAPEPEVRQRRRKTALTEGRASLGSDKSGYKLIGFFSRLNYDWQNKK